MRARPSRAAAAAVPPFVASLGCGSDNSTAPSNVQGTFTVSVTNGTDSCGFATWTDGQSSSNIPVAVTQNGNSATATVMGLQGTFLDTVLARTSSRAPSWARSSRGTIDYAPDTGRGLPRTRSSGAGVLAAMKCAARASTTAACGDEGVLSATSASENAFQTWKRAS